MVTVPANDLLMWHFEPTIYAGIAVTALLYAWLVRASRRRAAAGRRAAGAPGHPLWFYLGLVVLFLTLESPLDEIGERFLFWVHMAQHMLLAFAVAPMLLLGLRGRFPAVPDWVRGPVRALKPPTAPRIAAVLAWRALRFLTHPIVAILVFNGVFSAYHVPAVYQAGLASTTVHAFEHLALIVTALFTWWPVLSPLPELPSLSYPAQMVYVFLDGLGMTPIFAGMTFNSGVIYSWYAHAPRIMGFTALEDQQMGGIVMKVMGGAAYAAALLAAFYHWCRTDADATGPRFFADDADPELIAAERARVALSASGAPAAGPGPGSNVTPLISRSPRAQGSGRKARRSR